MSSGILDKFAILISAFGKVQGVPARLSCKLYSHSIMRLPTAPDEVGWNIWCQHSTSGMAGIS